MRTWLSGPSHDGQCSITKGGWGRSIAINIISLGRLVLSMHLCWLASDDGSVPYVNNPGHLRKARGQDDEPIINNDSTRC